MLWAILIVGFGAVVYSWVKTPEADDGEEN